MLLPDPATPDPRLPGSVVPVADRSPPPVEPVKSCVGIPPSLLDSAGAADDESPPELEWDVS